MADGKRDFCPVTDAFSAELFCKNDSRLRAAFLCAAQLPRPGRAAVTGLRHGAFCAGRILQYFLEHAMDVTGCPRYSECVKTVINKEKIFNERT
jgi:hypothetical protein